MKVLSMIIMSVVLVVGLSGCGKTLSELRSDGDAIIDNGAGAAQGIIGTVGEIAKRVIAAGFAVYDIGKKVVEDSKDNVGTAVNVVTGASETPKAP